MSTRAKNALRVYFGVPPDFRELPHPRFIIVKDGEEYLVDRWEGASWTLSEAATIAGVSASLMHQPHTFTTHAIRSAVGKLNAYAMLQPARVRRRQEPPGIPKTDLPDGVYADYLTVLAHEKEVLRHEGYDVARRHLKGGVPLPEIARRDAAARMQVVGAFRGLLQVISGWLQNSPVNRPRSPVQRV